MRISFEISRSRKKRAYEAADKGRRGKAFRMAKSTSVNSEVSAALVTLRDRSRNMVRNNGWARRAVEAITKHTIGEGISRRRTPTGHLPARKTTLEQVGQHDRLRLVRQKRPFTDYRSWQCAPSPRVERC